MKSAGRGLWLLHRGSHPVRGAWIEITAVQWGSRGNSSHPVRGAWIEIIMTPDFSLYTEVAPREGCVD